MKSMKKKITGLLLMLGMFGSLAVTAHADTMYGASGWQVSFTPEKTMASNFGTADMTEAIGGLQPGDSIVLTMNLKNEAAESTDWYMTNKVLYSLEDRSANTGTRGGAYTYTLIYTDKGGTDNVLFDSDTVGGSNAEVEGLHGATQALQDFFYLDTLVQGESGKITLIIALDGETQGNDYQNTLADLQMNFAVELTPDDSTIIRTRVVKTGDETNLTPYFIAMGVSGVLLLLLGFYGRRENKKGKKEAE